MRTRITFLGFAFALFAPAQRPVEIQFSGKIIADHIRDSLRGTEMVIRSDSGKIKGGLITFGAPLGSAAFPFSIPRYSLDLGWFGSVDYRVANMRLSSFAITADSRDFVLEADFEGKGPQFIGSHSALGRNVVPDVYLDQMKMTVRLRPCILKNGDPSYTQPRVTFKSHMRSEAMTFTAFGTEYDLLDSVTGYRDKVAHVIEKKMVECLSASEKRRALGKYLMQAISARAKILNMQIEKLHFEGTTLKLGLKLP